MHFTDCPLYISLSEVFILYFQLNRILSFLILHNAHVSKEVPESQVSILEISFMSNKHNGE